MPEDRDAFSDFVRALKAQLASEKLVLLLALPPKTCRGQTGLLCEAHDFRVLGRNADLCVLKKCFGRAWRAVCARGHRQDE